MKRRVRTSIASAVGIVLAILLSGPLSAQTENADPNSGIIVESVEPGSLGERAGLRPGDVLTTWFRSAWGWANPVPTAGTFRSWFDFDEVVTEQAPRGALSFEGTRDGIARRWTLMAGASALRVGIQVRPSLSADVQARYQVGLERFGAGLASAGSEAWRRGVTLAFARGRADSAVWLLSRASNELDRLRELNSVDDMFHETVEAARRAARPLTASASLSRWAESAWRRGRWELAERRSLEAMDQADEPKGPSLHLTARRRSAAEAFRQSERYKESESLAADAVSTLQQLAPGSLDEAQGLYEYGRGLSAQYKDVLAEKVLLEASLLVRRASPDSLDYVRILDALGTMYRGHGRVEEAQSLLQEALERAKTLPPSPYDEGRVFLHLAMTIGGTGDFARSSELLFDARRRFESLSDSSVKTRNLAITNQQLGWSFVSIGDLNAASGSAQEALRLQEALNPRSPEVAGILALLGQIERLRRNFSLAEEYLKKSLALNEAMDGGGLGTAQTLLLLGGMLADTSKRSAEAEPILRRALQRYELLAPRSASRFSSLGILGVIQWQLGRVREGAKMIEDAIQGLGQVGYDGVTKASLLENLGAIEMMAGQYDHASKHLCLSAEMLGRMGDRIGGVTMRSEFLRSFNLANFECLSVLVRIGRKEEAYQRFESWRAQSLLSLIVNRDLLSAELPPALARERAELRSSYSTNSSGLDAAEKLGNVLQAESLRNRLEQIQRQEEDLVARFRRVSPRFAALHHPVPVDLDGARAAMDRGTLFMAYAVGEKESYLLAVRPAGESDGLAVFRIPISEASLRAEVGIYQKLLLSPRSSRSQIASHGRRLYRWLLAPASSWLEKSGRLLIAPDGPLHYLPFAALMRPDGKYLIEWKPIHTVISATVYAELKKQRRPPEDPSRMEVAAFGDPSYSGLSAAKAELAGDLRVRSALRRGLSLTPLPSSRREVEALGNLYPHSEIYLGKEATEERAKALGKEVRIIHFAGHALLDEDLPLNSSLALSIPENRLPGQEDGLLQSWEIFEQMRLDADLVTLSACKTALGKEMGGEGLIGLTRAFQVAGARSILASLWSIGDRSTAQFMPRFYQHLRAGLTKDEALRRTQIEWIKNPKTSHPFHWAAFELIGDYK